MDRRRVRRLVVALLLVTSIQVGGTVAPAWAKSPQPCDEENDGEWLTDKRGRIWECDGAREEWVQIFP